MQTFALPPKRLPQAQPRSPRPALCQQGEARRTCDVHSARDFNRALILLSEFVSSIAGGFRAYTYMSTLR